MKYYIVLRDFEKQDWYLMKVDGKPSKFVTGAFIFKNPENKYCLVDEATGLTICYSKKLKWLESVYIERMQERYENYKNNNPRYEIQKERFEKLKLVYEYERRTEHAD